MPDGFDRSQDFLDALDARRAEILDACTRCGACVRVCPMPAADGLDVSDSEAVASGVIDLLRTGQGPEAARRWADICTGSGHCIPACEHGVNPRFMLALARIAGLRSAHGTGGLRAGGARQFGAMSQDVRTLTRLQLAPDLLARLGQIGALAPEPERPEVIFYTGCNVLKTPHIALLCLDVLDALGVEYAVRGGPNYCCGVYQFRAGDLEKFGSLAYRTIDRFAEAGVDAVLSWCPSCQVHLGEAALETQAAAEGAPFDLTPFVIYLENRLDDLRPLMTRRVEKRVGLHEHPGVAGIAEAAENILKAIPGLEFVDLAQPRVGYMCNTLSVLPDYKRDVHAEQLAAAEAAGVDALAGIYHACHRELCTHERDWPFEVVNFMELVGESMGFSRPDLFKRLKIMQDADAILADSADMIAEYGLDADRVREVVIGAMLGEQPLPLGRP